MVQPGLHEDFARGGEATAPTERSFGYEPPGPGPATMPNRY